MHLVLQKSLYSSRSLSKLVTVATKTWKNRTQNLPLYLLLLLLLYLKSLLCIFFFFSSYFFFCRFFSMSIFNCLTTTHNKHIIKQYASMPLSTIFLQNYPLFYFCFYISTSMLSFSHMYSLISFIQGSI